MAATTAALFMGGMGAVGSISNAYSQAQALKAKAAYQQTISKINAEISTIQAEDAIKRGTQAGRDYQKEVDKMIGTQRVAYAAQGVDVDFGSAAAVQEETRMQGALDVLTIKNNAFREAQGYKTEALNATFSGEFARIEGRTSSRQTLLAGGMDALSSVGRGWAAGSK